jgi:hypothetical protein
MQLERIGTITMSRISIEIPGEVNNGNGIEGALLDAYTATYQGK